MLIGPDELGGVGGAVGAAHLLPGVPLLVQVTGDFQLVRQDAHGEADPVLDVLVVGVVSVPVCRHVPETGQLGSHLHQLNQSPAGQPQVGVSNVVQDLVRNVLSAGACIV